MATITKIDACNQNSPVNKIRVAAYARVSTDSSEQLLSLETQKAHYEAFIKANPSWEFAGLYFDEGISGTKIEKRDSLQRLLKDCENGKVDRVITKSISRFSRSTTDCLEMVRSLSRLGVYIFFEKENIDTEFMSSELMLTILSSLAESESRSISENTKWSIKNRFETGSFIIVYPPYGYKNEDGKMVIVPDEAEVVKEIFNLSVSGIGSYRIAGILNERGLESKRGTAWHPSTVQGILKNEKYTGDAIFQKTYTDDNFTRHKNFGEKNMYLCRNHHEAIISHELFDLAQEVIRRRGMEKSFDSESNKYQNRYCFSGIIKCGECGASYKRIICKRGGGSYIRWSCTQHIADKDKCHMLAMDDAWMRGTFLKVLQKMHVGKDEILVPFISGLKGSNNKERLQKVNELEELIENKEEQKSVLMNLMSAGYIEPEIFQSEMNDLNAELEALKDKKKTMSSVINGDLTHIDEAQKLLKYLRRCESIEVFKDEMVCEFIDSITVVSREALVFNFKCGLRIKESVVKA